MIRLTRDPIDYHALTESVRDPHCGAVALFLGTVRDLTGEQVTVFLDYEAYAPMAEKKLAEIEAEVRRRWPVGDVAMVHRLGRLAVGEVSVAVAAELPAPRRGVRRLPLRHRYPQGTRADLEEGERTGRNRRVGPSVREAG